MPTTRDALVIVILFFIPGFIADGVLSKQFVRTKREATELVLNIILLTLVNYACLSPVLLWLYHDSTALGYRDYLRTYPGFSLSMALIFGFFAPALEGVIIGRVLRSSIGTKFLARVLDIQVNDPPTAWDYILTLPKDHYYFVIATLVDGSKVAGAFASRSYAASYPNDLDLYLEVVYTLDDEGQFGHPVVSSAGILLRRADIRSLEFFGPQESTNEHEHQEQHKGNFWKYTSTTITAWLKSRTDR